MKTMSNQRYSKGIWDIYGDISWFGKYYLFEVEVYVDSIGKTILNRVTDPYSVNLSINSKYSQIVDLNSDSLKPNNWNSVIKPELKCWEDITIYELHIRDFSSLDDSVPVDWRG